MSLRISKKAARALALLSLGLYQPLERMAQKADVLATIRRMGALQIDTIHVVARSPYLVLWSRLGDYDPRWLDELLAEGALFEYWGHAACFLPIEDYPLFRRRMLEVPFSWWDSHRWLEENRDLADAILERIRSTGGLRSADFEGGQKPPGGWWNWKVEKLALEHLFALGELMIARRDKFQRVYDLRERVMPGWEDVRTPTLEEMRQILTLRTVSILGIAPLTWVADYYRLEKRLVPEVVRCLVMEGALVQVEVEGWASPALVHPDILPLLESAEELQPRGTWLLSPFDPLVWDRRRVKELFGFDFTLECYLPASKRKYGYYLLPVLHDGALVARMDVKAHRTEGVFEVRGLFLEEGVRLEDGLAQGLGQALKQCAVWHGTPQLKVCPGGEVLLEVEKSS
jgi:uncharacterized protein YcaQ